ncbi:MAG: GAF domain-containing protein, partial [Oceanobacter sp.]
MSYPDYFHDPYLSPTKVSGLGEELQHRYQVLREQFSGIDRYSIALHHPVTNRLTTFVWGGEIETPLKGYSVAVDDVPALKRLASGGNVRVVNDMRGFRQEGIAKHSAALLGQGLRSSLTMPISFNGQWLGLMFLNSKQIDYFNRSVVVYCTLWAQWVGQVLGQQLDEAGRLSKLASKLNHKEIDCSAEKVSGIVHLMACHLL